MNKTTVISGKKVDLEAFEKILSSCTANVWTTAELEFVYKYVLKDHRKP